MNRRKFLSGVVGTGIAAGAISMKEVTLAEDSSSGSASLADQNPPLGQEDERSLTGRMVCPKCGECRHYSDYLLYYYRNPGRVGVTCPKCSFVLGNFLPRDHPKWEGEEEDLNV